jgi:hypothetical protein
MALMVTVADFARPVFPVNQEFHAFLNHDMGFAIIRLKGDFA